MATSTAQIFRRQVADLHRRSVEVPTGDGLASAFQLSGFPVASGTSQAAGSGTILSPVVAGWSFDWTNGVVTFPGIPSAGSAVGTAVYYNSTYSDEEIDYLLSANGNDLIRSHFQICNWLMSDAYTRGKWAANQGLQYDDSMTMKNLMMMWSALYQRIYKSLEYGNVGPIAWSETQAEYMTRGEFLPG